MTLEAVPTTPVTIDRIEILQTEKAHFVRSVSTDGAVGAAVTNGRPYLYPLLTDLILPCFVGRDARDLEALIADAYTYKSNYKLSGLAFWNCIAWVEFSLLDLLGAVANQPVGALMGETLRREVPVYLSSLRRDTTPEQEIEWVGRRLAETGATAVKLKIGGRMSGNADAAPGRSERLIALARATFGDAVTIYVDANGSYDAATAIEVGRMLEAHGVAFFEEPCPWEEFIQTKRVADALALPVAGGEQDSSLPKFAWMIENRGVDVVQPDLSYNGGFLRTRRVARMAEAAGLPVTPHSPQPGPNLAYIAQFASSTPNLGPHIEFNAAPRRAESWYAPNFTVENGVLSIPAGPGLGLTFDPDLLKTAARV